MAPNPSAVARFLAGRRIAVAGVSRAGDAPANLILRKLRAAGHEVVPINPSAAELEGVPCYRSLAAIPDGVDGVVIATHPDAAAGVVREAAARGVREIWFHRSFGDGSVSPAALDACRELGLEPIVGGCPLMYCEPVDVVHRCMRWWLARAGRAPR